MSKPARGAVSELPHPFARETFPHVHRTVVIARRDARHVACGVTRAVYKGARRRGCPFVSRVLDNRAAYGVTAGTAGAPDAHDGVVLFRHSARDADGGDEALVRAR